MIGTSLAVQWLRLCASNTEGMGFIPKKEAHQLDYTEGKSFASPLSLTPGICHLIGKFRPENHGT